VLPEPDFIYVPVGSGGTVAGLLLGCVLADVHTHIIAVAVEPEETVNEVENTLRKLFEETNQLLSSVSSRIPMVSFPEERLTINKEFVGEEYGQWLRVGEDATRLMKNEENIVLEGTYSAKALAALIADCKNQKRAKHEIILFWNTYCGLDFSPLTAHINYRQLPNAVHHYFEDAHLVDVGQLYPAIELDLKFATKDNFTGEVLYGKKQCLLLKPVAEQLGKAAQEFKALGYTVKMWDGYRPSKVSARLWELMPDDNFIANPKDGGSRHNRGCAVDLTLVDATGRELDMGTCFCEFSEKAYRDSQNVSELVLNNRKFLEMIMEKHGFVGLKTEWWHFDFKDWLQYPSLGVSLDK
jgi:D-alanyl-D-alanine dipeptidase